MALVDSTWVGPWGYTLPDGTVLIPGETVRQVPENQSDDDPYWEPVSEMTPHSKAPAGGDK